MILYKYRTPDDYSIEAVSNKNLVFKHVHQFNDPFDGMGVYYLSGDKDQFTRFIGKYCKLSNQKIDELWNRESGNGRTMFKADKMTNELDNLLCFCLSESQNDILMWSHYAQNHEGFCLGFNTFTNPMDTSGKRCLSLDNNSLQMDHNLEMFLAEATPITYTDIMPINNRLADDDSSLFKFITTKHSTWSYEKERRIIIPRHNILDCNVKAYGYIVNHKPECLSEVIFGVKCSNETKNKLIKTITNDYDINTILFYQCKYPQPPTGINMVNTVKYEVMLEDITAKVRE